MYLVVECTTTSAPRASGRWRYGDANVLSTTSRASPSWATCASAAMSAMPSSGFVGVSTMIARVSGRMAARTAATSASGTASYVTFHREKTLEISRNVPPYASFGMMMWSPGLQIVRSRVSSAAIPEAKARPRTPPSIAARHSSSAERLGLPVRLYS